MSDYMIGLLFGAGLGSIVTWVIMQIVIIKGSIPMPREHESAKTNPR